MSKPRGNTSVGNIDASDGSIGTENDAGSSIGQDGNSFVVDPTTFGNGDGFTDAGGDSSGTGDAGSSATGKKRGRKPGSTNKTKKRTVALDSLAGPIVGIHAALASFTKIEELAIDASEGKALSDALVTLAAEYDVTPNSKVAAWTGLAAVIAMVYGPRYMVISMKLKSARVIPPTENDGENTYL